jgi:hypothetical protein
VALALAVPLLIFFCCSTEKKKVKRWQTNSIITSQFIKITLKKVDLTLIILYINRLKF